MSRLDDLRAAAQDCRACPLYADATQVVFGRGPMKARAMLVGETPGDKEDQAGEPFVGPAGRELDRALETAGLERSDVYVTNAVKHFKFEERGKRRIHQKPTRAEIKACVGEWLDREIELIRPLGILAMGATAANALLGSKVKVTQDRGRPLEFPDLAEVVMVTVHPSSILRSRSDEERYAAREAFANDVAAFTSAL